MNTDIDTTQITDAPVITDLKGLSDTIHEMAKEQLKVNEAEAKMQAAVEDAKKQYEAAISPHTGLIATFFTGVANYAKQAIDTLFPKSKGGERKKTYPVLGHKLQLRSSSSIEAPADIIEKLAHLRSDLEASYVRGEIEIDQLDSKIAVIDKLLRVPPVEFNKDAAREAFKDPEAAKVLAELGIKETSVETFKVAFKFTPESTKP